MRNPARAGLEALRAALASFETPRLDLSRLAVGGHSSGGRTALDVAAFDNELGARAVFSYGASLVNSGMGSFAPRGSRYEFHQRPKVFSCTCVTGVGRTATAFRCVLMT